MLIKILIVEDNEDCCTLLKEFLKRSFPKAIIEHTISARIALNKMSDTFFDLVFSDMGLIDPFIGGASVVKYANEMGSYTVLYSGADVEKEEKPDFVLSKPFILAHYLLMISAFGSRILS